MKRTRAFTAAVPLLFLAAACNRSKPAANQATPAVPASVSLTQTYVNESTGYAYRYPPHYKILTASSYGKFSTAIASTIDTDVQDNENDQLVFVANEVPSMKMLDQASIAARIKAESLDQNNTVVTQVKVGTLDGYEVSDNVASDGITADRYFVQSPNGTVFELLVTKGNPTASAILESFSFAQNSK